MEDTNELERFRQQWREEVSARAQASSKAPTAPAKGPHKFSPISQSSASTAPKQLDGNDDHEDYHSAAALPGAKTEDDVHGLPGPSSKEPQSALEHYEAAVEREDQGNLGDSINLYRKAFRVIPALFPRNLELTPL